MKASSGDSLLEFLLSYRTRLTSIVRPQGSSARLTGQDPWRQLEPEVLRRSGLHWKVFAAASSGPVQPLCTTKAVEESLKCARSRSNLFALEVGEPLSERFVTKLPQVSAARPWCHGGPYGHGLDSSEEVALQEYRVEDVVRP